MTMRTSYRYARTLHFLLITALSTTVANGQELAHLAPATVHVAEPTHRPAHTDGRVPADISDDGNNNERVPTTSQLVVTYTGEQDMTFTLDILDEKGHMVRHHVLDPARSQRYWTIDVEHLRTGRYVARVLCAQGAVVNRFRRD